MFITLEGPDGSGKTTQFRRLAVWLGAQGLEVLMVREPGGTVLGESVRELLLQGRGGAMDARAELLLFCASRAQLVSERILPHLEAGGVVLCDRFADSTLAYQGYGRGLDLDLLRVMLNFATCDRWPDLTLYFDLEAEVALARRTAGGEVNRLDAESLDFHRRVRIGYLELVARDPRRWVVIDARPPADEVERKVRGVVAAHFEQQRVFDK
ncbi:MAG: dTMP kinase [Chloroflexi bacterium]|nr:dTMP kinase [Chloroflexota bacterium]